MTESFEAVVDDVREERRVEGRAVWQIALSTTNFSVGDTGVLVAFSRKGSSLAIPIVRVVCDGEGRVWHVAEKPLATGTAVSGSVTAK